MRWFARAGKDESRGAASESPEAAAARWLARRELGLFRSDEAAEFERWRGDPQNEAALAALREPLERIHAAAAQPGIVRMREEALAEKRRGPLLLGNVPAAVAAGILLAVLTIALVSHDAGQPGSSSPGEPVVKATSRIAAAHPSPRARYETRKGEFRTVRLSDGSALTLNTASQVEVELTPKSRNVRLLSGQALFDVASDKGRPFTVAAGQLIVTALGTQFDVRVERERAKVVLLEGRVRVDPLSRNGIARYIPALDRHYLQAGEELIAKGQGEMSVAIADTEQSTSWQHGRLVFRGELLQDAVAEFNRYNDHQIAIEDPWLARLPVSGVFSTTRPENFLAAISSFYAVRIEERGPHVTVLRQRPE